LAASNINKLKQEQQCKKNSVSPVSYHLLLSLTINQNTPTEL